MKHVKNYDSDVGQQKKNTEVQIRQTLHYSNNNSNGQKDIVYFTVLPSCHCRSTTARVQLIHLSLRPT